MIYKKKRFQFESNKKISKKFNDLQSKSNQHLLKNLKKKFKKICFSFLEFFKRRVILA